jgi:hypothetical protein
MAFPSSPTLNQIVTEAGRSYIWNGTVWNLNSVVAGHASTHAAGAADAVTIATSQITGLASVATSGSAADLSTGTLSDARLSARAAASVNLYLWQTFR